MDKIKHFYGVDISKSYYDDYREGYRSNYSSEDDIDSIFER